jgi:predicted nuclease of restriction endonuclease-like (RecB) superfamily
MAVKRARAAIKSRSEQKRRQRGRADRSAMFPVPPPASDAPASYADWLAGLKARIRQERLRVVLVSNAVMVLLYWDLGRSILEKQADQGWGSRVIDRLAADLREAFPEMKGFSPRNLKYMRAFAAAWPDRAIVQQLAAQIPWFHNCVLLDRVPDSTARGWYIRQVVEHGWSRSILALQIEAQAHRRHGKAQTNFPATLPPPDSDMAVQVFKDPYLFDFLGTDAPRREAELEAGLVGLGYQVLHGPEIAVDAPSTERNDPSYGDVVLERRLQEALLRLNPDLPFEAQDDPYRKIVRADVPSLLERNRAVHRMLVDGVTVEYRRADGSIAGAQARVIDFDTPANNDWLAVNQFTVAEG